MCISELWDKIKQLLEIHGIRVPEEERIEQRKKKLFEEIMTKNLLKLMKTINLQIQEAQQTQAGLIPRKHTEHIQSNC